MFVRQFTARLTAALVAIPFVPAAFAAHLHVENYGLDTNTCGAGDPCRSISMAIQHAAAGDVISVGPGVYGDLNQNGVLGEPGEETGEIGFGCNCVVKVDKAVTIHSTQGAKVTRIDARSVSPPGDILTHGVHIMADNVVFGAPEKGFQITGASSYGVFIESAHAKVSGNLTAGPGNGFWVAGESNELDADVAVNDGNGFLITEANNTVTRSIASGSRDFGFTLSRGSVRSGPTGVVLNRDVSIGNQQGFNILGSATLTKVAAVGNLGGGIVLRTGAVVNVSNSNIFGNGGTAGGCGVINQSDANTVVVSNSFWGAASGPGPAPANMVCDDVGSTTLVPSVASQAFWISPDP